MTAARKTARGRSRWRKGQMLRGVERQTAWATQRALLHCACEASGFGASSHQRTLLRQRRELHLPILWWGEKKERKMRESEKTRAQRRRSAKECEVVRSSAKKYYAMQVNKGRGDCQSMHFSVCVSQNMYLSSSSTSGRLPHRCPKHTAQMNTATTRPDLLVWCCHVIICFDNGVSTRERDCSLCDHVCRSPHQICCWDALFSFFVLFSPLYSWAKERNGGYISWKLGRLIVGIG